MVSGPSRSASRMRMRMGSPMVRKRSAMSSTSGSGSGWGMEARVDIPTTVQLYSCERKWMSNGAPYPREMAHVAPPLLLHLSLITGSPLRDHSGATLGRVDDLI